MSPGGGGGPARPLTLTFLGTRGGIEARSRRHARHSVLRVAHRGRTVLLDCGADWRGRVRRLAPDAILLTHAHPDHAGGLAGGAPCPVYAVAATWATLRAAAVTDRRVLTPRRHHRVAGLAVQAFPLVHSQRAPAVGYRIRAGGAAFFYAPDVAALPGARAALRGLALYVGDGATLTRPILRARDGTLIGHAAIRAQLAWCRRAGVPRAIFTHCGSALVRAAPAETAAAVREMGRRAGVEARVAHDGLTLRLGGGAAMPHRERLRHPPTGVTVPRATGSGRARPRRASPAEVASDLRRRGPR